MQIRSRQEQYQSFLDFVNQETQRERRNFGRRMFYVFLWCFVLPTMTLLFFLFLLRFQIIPRAARNYLEWIILIFPVCYSLYVLSVEVLKNLPSVIRRGGVATHLEESVKEFQWRDKILEGMQKLGFSLEEWRLILAHYKIDLSRMKYRAGYLTIFAMAIFYFLIQGVDLFGESEPAVRWYKSPMGWIETTSNDLTQYVGLGIFLVLFYLSGSQTVQSLNRYYECGEILRVQLENRIKQRENS